MEALISTRDVFDFLKDKECINYIEISCKYDTNIQKFLYLFDDGLKNECFARRLIFNEEDNSASCNIF
jgi:hypothetical protein